MIISGLKANKMHIKTHCFDCKQTYMEILDYIVLHCIDFYDVNLTISPLDRLIPGEFTKEFSRMTSLIYILCM